MSETEPLWRKVLAWGAVLIFIGVPPGLLLLQITDALNPRDVEVAKSMSPMYFAVAGVVASLAGLGTWVAVKNGSNGKK